MVSALPNGALGTGIPCAVGARPTVAAVVGEEKNERVLIKTQFHNLAADLPNTLIHCLNHPLISNIGRRGVFPAAGTSLRRVTGTLNGLVYCFVSNVEAEGLVPVFFDELQGILVYQVRSVSFLLGFNTAVPPVVFVVVAIVAGVIDVAAEVADEIIKAVVKRMVFGSLGCVAEVPLADKAGGVTGFPECFGECYL